MGIWKSVWLRDLKEKDYLTGGENGNDPLSLVISPQSLNFQQSNQYLKVRFKDYFHWLTGVERWKESFISGGKLREEEWLAPQWWQPGVSVSPPSSGGVDIPSTSGLRVKWVNSWHNSLRVRAQSLQSCPTLCIGILQARILFPFSRESSWPWDWTHVSWIFFTVGRVFTAEPLGGLCFFPSKIITEKPSTLLTLE